MHSGWIPFLDFYSVTMVRYSWLVLAACVVAGLAQDAFYEERQRLKENDSCTTSNLSRGKCTRVRQCRRWREFFLKDGTFGFAHCGVPAIGVICCPFTTRSRPAPLLRPAVSIGVRPDTTTSRHQVTPALERTTVSPPCSCSKHSGNKEEETTPHTATPPSLTSILGQPALPVNTGDSSTGIAGQTGPGNSEATVLVDDSIPTVSPKTLTGVVPGRGKLEFTITATFSGNELDPKEYINMTLSGIQGSRDLLWVVEAPFYDNSDSKNAEPGTLLIGDFEVSTLFLMNENEEYLELELEPYGQYRAFFLHPLRQLMKSGIEMASAVTSRNGNTWRGEVIIPFDTLPPNISRFNMYHTYRIGEDRKYVSVLPTAIITLSSFHPLDLSKLRPDFVTPTEYSEIWKSAL